MRYGENPHQQAALYGNYSEIYEQLQGKELSYNNLLDITAATYLIGEFEEATVAILKHTNPCGVASADSILDAWHWAFETDKQASFGGIIVVNRTVDEELALAIKEIFENKSKYGFVVRTSDLYKYPDTKKIILSQSNVNLANYSDSLGINYKILQEFNPWLRDKKLTNKSSKRYTIILPNPEESHIFKK